MPRAHAGQGCVEDTKGNNGEAGELLVTNLRVIWSRRGLKRTNISIGLDCIAHITVKPAASRLKGARTPGRVLRSLHASI